jgi:hypothetical protein
MASIDRSDPVILSHVLAEHRDLFNLMQTVRSAWTEPGMPLPQRRRAVVASLRFLRDHLHEHFVQEERGGFLEEAVARVPRLSRAVRSIVGQHASLLAELDGVIEGLDSPPAADDATAQASWQRAGDAFAEFAAHMTAHERAENTVVQDGYNEDLGLVE